MSNKKLKIDSKGDLLTAVKFISFVFDPLVGHQNKHNQKTNNIFKGIEKNISNLDQDLRRELFHISWPTAQIWATEYPPNPSLTTKKFLQYFFSCIGFDRIDFFEANFTPSPDLEYRYSISGSSSEISMEDGSLVIFLKEDKPKTEFIDFNSFNNYFDNYNELCNFLRLESSGECVCFKYIYDGSDHAYYSLIFIHHENAFKDSNLDEIGNILEFIFNSFRRSIRKDLLTRSYNRHSIVPTLNSIFGRFEVLKKRYYEEISNKNGASFDWNELERQLNKISQKVSKLSVDPFNQYWLPNVRDFLFETNEATKKKETIYIPIETREYSLRECIREVRRGNFLQFNQRIKIESLPSKLEVFLILDRSKFIEIIEEIIRNASKYSIPRTPIFAFFHIDSKERPTLYIVNISDPIAPSDRPLLTRPGFRGQNAPVDVDGSGLGLSRVKELCKLLDIRFRVDTTSGTQQPYGYLLENATTRLDSYGIFAVKIGFKANYASVTGEER